MGTGYGGPAPAPHPLRINGVHLGRSPASAGRVHLHPALRRSRRFTGGRMTADDSTASMSEKVTELAGGPRPRTRRRSLTLSFELITGGRIPTSPSEVSDHRPDGDWVLRRPPLKQVLATAHDMGREHRHPFRAGQDTDVPVCSTVVGLCTDASVNGAPFLRDGVRRRSHHGPRRSTDARPARPWNSRGCRASRVDRRHVLARIHDVDIDAVGLGELGKQGGLHRTPTQALVRAIRTSRSTRDLLE